MGDGQTTEAVFRRIVAESLPWRPAKQIPHVEQRDVMPSGIGRTAL
ncbi:MAG: hypothetical protein KF866_07945 [Phycisphaeraceae bacterium]|nr:hypothetical protein [Phycisphaeraceae bacterium]MCW5753807.1 hypothetical protein [Phycisphaeraceae bacterium]